MKKEILLSVLFLVGVLCLSACSNGDTSEDSQTSDTTQQEEQKNSEEEETEQEESVTEEESEAKEEDAKTQTAAEEPVNITIYYSNDDATGFASEEVQIPSLTPEEVLNALVDKGTMAADVRIRSFETTTVEEKTTIELDFSSEFSSYVSSMGSTGEYYVMGSVCNTFLDAYDCEQIKITVEGQVLSTGHAEYPGYMSKFAE